jgi:RNA polymerase sigma-70 factor (ECF subfamily)
VTEEAARSEPGGLEKVFLDHHERVFRAAFRITGRAEDAEDVLQTVFLRLSRRPEGALPVGNISSYLYRSAVNASFDVLRARQAAPSAELEEAAGTLEAPDRLHESAVAAAWLRRSLSRLAPRAAEIFALRYLEEYDNHEIAKMLGVSRVTVAVTLHRARGRLQKDLRKMRRPGS